MSSSNRRSLRSFALRGRGNSLVAQNTKPGTELNFSVSSALQNTSKRRPNIKAQRKFAQGVPNNIGTIVPKELTLRSRGVRSSNSYSNSSNSFFKLTSSVHSDLPKTEDFLTFLCLRGTHVLPVDLDFFNHVSTPVIESSGAEDEEPADYEDAGLIPTVLQDVDYKTNKDKRGSGQTSVFELKKKYREQRIRKTHMMKKNSNSALRITRSQTVSSLKIAAAETPKLANRENKKALRSTTLESRPKIKQHISRVYNLRQASLMAKRRRRNAAFQMSRASLMLTRLTPRGTSSDAFIKMNQKLPMSGLSLRGRDISVSSDEQDEMEDVNNKIIKQRSTQSPLTRSSFTTVSSSEFATTNSRVIPQKSLTTKVDPAHCLKKKTSLSSTKSDESIVRKTVNGIPDYQKSNFNASPIIFSKSLKKKKKLDKCLEKESLSGKLAEGGSVDKKIGKSKKMVKQSIRELQNRVIEEAKKHVESLAETTESNIPLKNLVNAKPRKMSSLVKPKQVTQIEKSLSNQNPSNCLAPLPIYINTLPQACSTSQFTPNVNLPVVCQPARTVSVVPPQLFQPLNTVYSPAANVNVPIFGSKMPPQWSTLANGQILQPLVNVANNGLMHITNTPPNNSLVQPAFNYFTNQQSSFSHQLTLTHTAGSQQILTITQPLPQNHNTTSVLSVKTTSTSFLNQQPSLISPEPPKLSPQVSGSISDQNRSVTFAPPPMLSLCSGPSQQLWRFGAPVRNLDNSFQPSLGLRPNVMPTGNSHLIVSQQTPSSPQVVVLPASDVSVLQHNTNNLPTQIKFEQRALSTAAISIPQQETVNMVPCLPVVSRCQEIRPVRTGYSTVSSAKKINIEADNLSIPNKSNLALLQVTKKRKSIVPSSSQSNSSPINAPKLLHNVNIQTSSISPPLLSSKHDLSNVEKSRSPSVNNDRTKPPLSVSSLKVDNDTRACAPEAQSQEQSVSHQQNIKVESLPIKYGQLQDDESDSSVSDSGSEVSSSFPLPPELASQLAARRSEPDVQTKETPEYFIPLMVSDGQSFGVRVKIKTQGPSGPGQKIIMKAKLVEGTESKKEVLIHKGQSSPYKKMRTDDDDILNSTENISDSCAASKEAENSCSLGPIETMSTFPLNKSCLIDAPVYKPTEREFKDPLSYLHKLRDVAEQFGICRIVPPSSFKPECNVDDDMRFTAYNQYLHKMMHRWGSNAREMAAIKKYLETQNIEIKVHPLVGGVEIDLPALYHAVQSFGGLTEVIQRKKWGKIADFLRLPKGSQDRGNKLDDIYCKYLLPYDTLLFVERDELLRLVDEEWEEKQNERIRKLNSNPQGGLTYDEEEQEEGCVEKGKTTSLAAFYRVARNYMSYKSLSSCGGVENQTCSIDEMSLLARDVEEEFFRNVVERDCHVHVQQGSIDTGTGNSAFGFATSRSSSCGRHPWNLKIFSNNRQSLLRCMGPVMGVTVPTLHIGMLFTTSCWHRDQHGLPWVEYHHTGAPKIWYGVPPSQQERFHAALKKISPTLVSRSKIWLAADTIMVPPNILVNHGVSVVRTIQAPGEFVVVFPQTFTSSICTGYSIAESVFYAPTDYLDKCHEQFSDIRESAEVMMFPLPKLLFAIANDIVSSRTTLIKLMPHLERIRDWEYAKRMQLTEMGVRKSERINLRHDGDAGIGTTGAIEEDEYECYKCNANLYVSFVFNAKNDIYFCLDHGIDYIQNNKTQKKHCKLFYTHSKEEITRIIMHVKERIEMANVTSKTDDNLTTELEGFKPTPINCNRKEDVQSVESKNMKPEVAATAAKRIKKIPPEKLRAPYVKSSEARMSPSSSSSSSNVSVKSNVTKKVPRRAAIDKAGHFTNEILDMVLAGSDDDGFGVNLSDVDEDSDESWN